MSEYLYDRFNLTQEYKEELIEFIRHNTNVEIGGYRVFDGMRTHLMQNPYELSDFIFALKKYERERGTPLKKFLEVGFSAGINNSLLNKFFEFDEVVGIDTFAGEISGNTLKANLMFKNITLICGDSTSQRVINIVRNFGTFDVIFIDANHSYEYVKEDFHNYLPLLNEDGIIGFHDIDCPDWPGINRFWNELKDTGKYNQKEFVKHGFALRYGIGMLTIK